MGSQIIGIGSAWIFYEEHNIVFYIESELRPLITNLISPNSFWGYETYLLRARKKGYLIFGYSPVIAALFVFIALTIYTFLNDEFKIQGTLGFALNLIFLLLFYYRTDIAVKMQKSAWKSMIKTEK